MIDNKLFDVIIIGGSYSGLAAGMALGRALKKVLVIDGGKPCNVQTAYSHNFITQDGNTPAEIAALANLQVRRYDTVKFLDGLVISANKTEIGFEIHTASGEYFAAKELIFATGIKDMMEDIAGFDACWGISILHCPYCHGYEVRNKKTGILGNGKTAFDLTRLISNWTNNLTLFTNGPATLAPEQVEQLAKHNVTIIEKEVDRFEQAKGYIEHVVFRDRTIYAIDALYTAVPFEQHCKIPASLGCELTDDGYIKIDGVHETIVKGVYACGDNVSRMRTVANAVAMGTTVGMAVSKKMIIERF